MAAYLLRAAYASGAWVRMTKVRIDDTMGMTTVAPIVKKLGGRFVEGWLAFGKDDLVAILDLPDNVSAAAVSIALSITGDFKAVKTTPLITYADGRKALSKVKAAGLKRRRK